MYNLVPSPAFIARTQLAYKKSAWYILMRFCLCKNGIAHVYDVYTIGICLAVKQGEPPEKACRHSPFFLTTPHPSTPLPILPHHLFLTVSNPSPLIFTISVMVCLLFYINSFTSLAPNLLSLRSYSLIILIYTLSSLTVSHKPILAGCVCK